MGEGKRRFEPLFEHANDAIALVEFHGETPVIQAVNPEFRGLFAPNGTDVVGRDLDAIVASGGRTEQAREVSRQAKDGLITSQELTRGTVEGTRDFFWQLVPAESVAAGSIRRAFAIYTDITDRKEHERELERYETLVEGVGDPMYMLDDDGHIDMVNAAMVAALGAPAAAIVGEHASTVMSDGDFERGTELIQELLTEPDRRWGTFTITVEPVSGDPFLAEVNLGVLLDDDGRYRGSTGVVRDITERVEMTGRLESQKNRIQSLHGAAHDIVDSRNRVEVYEKTVGAAERVLDFELCSAMVYEEGMLVPKAVSAGAQWDGVRPMEPDEGTAGHVFQTGEPVVIEDVQTDDTSKPAKESYRSAISVPIGELGVFQAVATEPRAFDDSDVEIAELLLAYTALTVNRIRSEEELARHNERLDEFAGVVSHDLRNPLNVAQGRLELARESPDAEHIDAIENALSRMGDLLDDVLALARQGEHVSNPEPVELAEVFERSWSTVRTGDGGYVIETDQTILADESRLRQLLENLTRNAVEHGPADVTVSIGDLDDGFYVEDDGPGIPEDERTRVAEAGYSTVPDGTGFGLSIVREIATAHGWTFEITAGTDGGARFEFRGCEAPGLE